MASFSGMCLYDQQWTSDVPSQHCDMHAPHTTAIVSHATVVCRLCCTDVGYKVITSQVYDVTSPTACRCAVLTDLSPTSRTTCCQLTLARYSSSHQRTVDDHGGRQQCPWDISFLWCECFHQVDWVCRPCTSWWYISLTTKGRWRTPHRQHTRCHLTVSLHAQGLQHVKMQF